MRALGSLVLVCLSATQVAASDECRLPGTVGLQPPSERQVAEGFGRRFHPLLGAVQLHTGVDYPGPVGDPVAAAANGRVVTAKYVGEFGNHVVIDHGGGLQTSYSHLSRLAVRPGDCVKAGDPIGQVGSTGLSVMPHLHFEVVLDGSPVDPAPLLPSR
jgi:murein DD-endopeptidase MepM/ murein hydrolase activator NlpD